MARRTRERLSSAARLVGDLLEVPRRRASDWAQRAS